MRRVASLEHAIGISLRSVPHQNRVTPFSELVADPARGLVYGNRGCLHDANGVIRRRYGGKRWISCRLEFRGWQRGALAAAGEVHRALLPRRGDRVRRGAPPVRALPQRGLPEVRDTLARTPSRRRIRGRCPRCPVARRSASIRRLRRARPAALRGAVRDAAGRGVRRRGGGRRSSCSESSYCGGRRPATTCARARPDGRATVLTPPSLVGVLRRGWDGVVPLLHPSAEARATG